MDKKIVFILLIVGLVLVSGCVSPEIKKGTDAEKPKQDFAKDSQVKTTETPKGDTQVKSSEPSKSAEQSDSNIDPTKNCGPGEAIQGFDLEKDDGTTCVSIPTGRTEVSAQPDEPANDGTSTSDVGTVLTSVVNWILRIDGDTNTDSRIGDGNIVNLQSGEGVSLLKDGNTVTISSTAVPQISTQTTSNTSAGSTYNPWTLTAISSKIGSTSMGIGSGGSLKVKGNGITSVSLDTKLRELTISSPEYVWKLAGGILSLPFEIKKDDVVRFVGSGATAVTQDATNKKITISTPATKQYQYKTVYGWCDEGSNDIWTVRYKDTGLNMECRYERGILNATCTTGKIINYGGYCQSPGSNDNAIQSIGPTNNPGTSNDGYSTSWSDLPTISEIEMMCREDSTIMMHVWLTCVREKP